MLGMSSCIWIDVVLYQISIWFQIRISFQISCSADNLFLCGLCISGVLDVG